MINSNIIFILANSKETKTINMKKILLTLLTLILLSAVVSAQKDYKNEADVAFSGYKYYQAIEMYKKAYTKESKAEVKAEILYQIAECYRLKQDGKQAAVWYEKSIKAKDNIKKDGWKY